MVLSVVVAGLQTGYFDPWRPSPLYEQNAVTILRPVIHYFFDLQPRGTQLLDRNFLWDAVPAPVARNSFHRFQPRARREIDDRQPPSGPQGPHQAGVELRRLCQVMVHASQENRLAASCREMPVRLLGLNYEHVPQRTFSNLILIVS